MKRILQVIGQLGRGGDTTVVLDVVRHADPAKYQFDFMTHDHADPDIVTALREKGHTVYQLAGDLRKLGFRQYCKTVYEILKNLEQPYDIIHTHTSVQSGVVLKAAKKAGIPVRICHSHVSALQRRAGKLQKLALPYLKSLYLSNATKLVACSRMAGDYLYGKHDYILIYNSVDTERFKNVSEEQVMHLRQSFGLNDQMILVGHVANFGDMKNQNYDLDLAEKLQDRPDIHFILVGKGKNLAKIKNQARPFGGKIIFTGQRSDVQILMKSFDILILPSLPGEGFPVTVIEAQASGLPCLISEHVTKESDTGIGLVRQIPLTDQQAWLEAIRTIGRQNDYRKRSEAAVHLRDNGFGHQQFIDSWMKLYV